jgi:hypothetical protein
MPKSPSPQLVKTAEELRLDEARENGVPWKQWADPWASWRRSHSAVRFSVRRPPRQDGLIRLCHPRLSGREDRRVAARNERLCRLAQAIAVSVQLKFRPHHG